MYSSSEHPYSFVNLNFFLVQTPGPIGKLPICMCVYTYIYKIHMYINKDDVRNDEEDNRKMAQRGIKKWCEEKYEANGEKRI